MGEVRGQAGTQSKYFSACTGATQRHRRVPASLLRLYFPGEDALGPVKTLLNDSFSF